MYNYSALLKAYRSLWNNRMLIENEMDENILKGAILRELKDENSHPRVRKSAYEKHFLAIKRITESNLLDSEKLQLIQLHTDLMKEI